jgi:hypothetical protein
MAHRNFTTQIRKLTFLGLFLNGAAGSGKYDSITIDQVQSEIESGNIFTFLKARLGSDVDLSLTTDAERSELIEEWRQLINVAEAKRKFLVTRGGLTLLVAYLLEGIQSRTPSA